MKVEIPMHDIVIKDKASGKEFTVRTLRTAEDIAGYVEESEKDQVAWRVERAVNEAYDK
jgi:hypothetical protein